VELTTLGLPQLSEGVLISVIFGWFGFCALTLTVIWNFAPKPKRRSWDVAVGIMALVVWVPFVGFVPTKTPYNFDCGSVMQPKDPVPPPTLYSPYRALDTYFFDGEKCGDIRNSARRWGILSGLGLVVVVGGAYFGAKEAEEEDPM